ncbi:hypothetical protein L596_027574 [Steinernema carpocapsae]|uniref:Uncharacterized protein n=1 Tax=Steinernema carpocapsae TaxID=34508 RepID=A0A4U5LVW9_STECR|nr:hypothetical protein L596_027574 [Steinernema carpocapsae]
MAVRWTRWRPWRSTATVGRFHRYSPSSLLLPPADLHFGFGRFFHRRLDRGFRRTLGGGVLRSAFVHIDRFSACVGSQFDPKHGGGADSGGFPTRISPESAPSARFSHGSQHGASLRLDHRGRRRSRRGFRRSAAPTLGIAPSAPAQVSSATAQVPIGSIGIKPPGTLAQSPAPGTQAAVKRREIYKFESRDPLFAAAWSYKPSKRFRLAVGTIDPESFPNKVSIVQLDEQSEVLAEQFSFDHPFTVNCLGFIPDKNDQFPDLLATSADCLRIYNINPDNTVTLETSLNNSRAPNYASPLTNFDWNVMDPTLIGTCSIDTTCTIWELRTGKAIGMTSPENKTSGTVKTQLIAHDKPVHDIKFSKFGNGRDHFATVGADGSARMFDLRNLQHSTIVYEDPLHHPLMRLAWNNKDSHYLATFAMDANEVIIIDIRVPCNPLAKLNNHRLCVNGVAWAPHSHSHICTAGDDHQALIWDLRTMQQRNVEDPILAYQAGGEVNQVHWSSTNTDWISICFKNSLEILRV